jgi:hypothetical protein
MSDLRDAFVEYIKLTEVDISNMTLEELYDHRHELNRQRELGLRLIDEMEAHFKPIQLPIHK